MKYLRMFEAASGLFPKKIKVALIDAVTGKNLGKHKIPAELLPAAFNRPTMLEINNIKWRVLQADPVLADDFLFSKKLTLKVLHAEQANAQQLKYNLPTVCNEMPLVTGVPGLYNDFTLEIQEEDWRQIEFLSLERLKIIEEAVKNIEVILSSQSTPLLGYDKQYIRDNALQSKVFISWEEFCSVLINPVKGNIFFRNNDFVQNGFAIRSESYTYYGILENGFIRTLCLSQFGGADDEFMNVLSKFELSLVDWCNASRMSAETGEAPQNEYIKI